MRRRKKKETQKEENKELKMKKDNKEVPKERNFKIIFDCDHVRWERPGKFYRKKCVSNAESVRTESQLFNRERCGRNFREKRLKMLPQYFFNTSFL
jgi:hypothetical protein